VGTMEVYGNGPSGLGYENVAMDVEKEGITIGYSHQHRIAQTPTSSQHSPHFNRGPENIWPAGHPEHRLAQNVFALFFLVWPP
jgi:hypothetical protein